MLAWQSTPHFLFDLAEKKTGRGRSKRKERYGGSVRASAYLRPPARESWHSLVVALIKRGALGETFGPGRARIPDLPLSAGAAFAVNAGRRVRRPLQGIAGIRQMSGQIGPPPQRHSAAPAAPFIPRRGGCPHPPVSSPHPPPDKAQAHSEGRAFRHPPRVLHQTGTRGARLAQVSSPARAGRRLPCPSRNRFGRPPF